VGSSFGERLKKERDRKKITLDQVAVSTKISTRMLRALEEEKFDQLPGGIFNKGFVRAYARYLGLNEEKAIADYMSAAGGPAQPQAEDLELRAMAEQKEREIHRQGRLSEKFPWGWVTAFLLLGATVLSVWGWYSRAGNRSGAAVQAAQVESAVRSNPADLAHYQPSVSTQTGSQPRVQFGAGTFSLVVKAEEDSWVTIVADGSPVFSGMLVAPADRNVSARNSVTIKAGNIGGLDFSFNGKRLASQGDYGEVKTLTFSSAGLQPPAPATGVQ
jgi:cytoskeletal protein RodZ